MPDVTITAPMAADSIDRLTLSSCCPLCGVVGQGDLFGGGLTGRVWAQFMAEE